MKLLIITQKVDRDDPILGFFHRWIAEFSKRCEHVTVIGQEIGTYELPSNVHVLSLRKEKKWPRFIQILRFWILIVRHRHAYDVVLVHMTPIWVALGWKFWFVLRKQIYLWYEARGGRWPLRIASLCVRKVFSASKRGMPIRTRKSVVVGHGIDIDRFVPGETPRDATLFVTVGRITAAKRLPILLHVLAALEEPYHIVIVGVPVTAADRSVDAGLRDLIRRLHLERRVVMQAMSHEDLPSLLQRATLFLHASETALDKAVLEAMACGCVVISCANAVQSVLPETLRASPEQMARVVQWFCSLPKPEQDDLRQALRAAVTEHHSLSRLIERLCEEMSPL
ncbi:glycosyltransferase family 4 protein [Candidatus Peregrinibacteria bacterium]|nr:glycosyltransferase family 4 protein [Candidatus Peregrinibacteria bacterium]